MYVCVEAQRDVFVKEGFNVVTFASEDNQRSGDNMVKGIYKHILCLFSFFFKNIWSRFIWFFFTFLLGTCWIVYRKHAIGSGRAHLKKKLLYQLI